MQKNILKLLLLLMITNSAGWGADDPTQIPKDFRVRARGLFNAQQAQVRSQTDTIASQQQLLASLQTNSAQKDQTIAQMAQQQIALAQALAEQQKMMAALQERNAVLDERLRASEGEITLLMRARDDAETLRAAVAIREGNLRRLEEEKSKLALEKQQLEQRLRTIEEQKQEGWQEEKKQLEEQIRELDHQVKEKSSQIIQFKTEIEESHPNNKLVKLIKDGSIPDDELAMHILGILLLYKSEVEKGVDFKSLWSNVLVHYSRPYDHVKPPVGKESQYKGKNRLLGNLIHPLGYSDMPLTEVDIRNGAEKFRRDLEGKATQMLQDQLRQRHQ